MACSAAELAVVLAVLAPVLSSRRALYLNRGGFEGEGVAIGGVSSDELKEAVDSGPYGLQWQAWRRSVPACLTAPKLL
jgi:hypothetical protein